MGAWNTELVEAYSISSKHNVEIVAALFHHVFHSLRVSDRISFQRIS